MKKHVPIIIVLLLLSSLLFSCSNDKKNIPDEPLNQHLIAKSIELTRAMDGLAQNSELMLFYLGQSELLGLAAEIGAGDYEFPNKAVLITVSDAAIDSIIKDYVGGLNLADDAHDMFIARICASIPNYINGQQGVSVISTTSVLAVNKAFQQHKDFSGNVYVILIYDNFDSVTLFRNSSGGITAASSTFLFLTEDMKEAVMDETVGDYLYERYNVRGIEIEYIAGDKIKQSNN